VLTLSTVSAEAFLERLSSLQLENGEGRDGCGMHGRIERLGLPEIG